jgi:hypothetical protein
VQRAARLARLPFLVQCAGKGKRVRVEVEDLSELRTLLVERLDASEVLLDE